MNIQLLDAYCASKKTPIRVGDSHDFTVNCRPMSESWKADIAKSKWWAMPQQDNPALAYDWFDPRLLQLRDALLNFGGESACLPDMEEDLTKILSRGQLWSGSNLKMMRGQPSQCHENSSELWNENQDKLFIATGYGLSDDGMWRQHSWCVHPKPKSVQIIETTVPCDLYFGFVMNLEETNDFCDGNTFYGATIKPETIEKWESLFGQKPASRRKP